MDKRTFLRALGVAFSVPGSAAWAQPAKGSAVRVVVPLPAGSATDTFPRLLLPMLGAATGQNYFIDNKPGGNGIIGVKDVVRAAPDGNTLLCASNSHLASNVAFYKNLGYDPRKDLTPIAAVMLTNHVLVVKADSQIRSFADFLAHAKANPGKVSIGYSTTSVQTQIATMSKLAGVDLLPVPYKGTSATINDVMGGVLAATLLGQGDAQAQTKGGHLRALAITTLKRNPLTPDWPAISETLPGYDFSVWVALMGPAGMSRELVTRVSDAVKKAQSQRDLIDKYAHQGATPLTLGPDELKAFIDAETTRWVRLARAANIQPE